MLKTSAQTAKTSALFGGTPHSSLRSMTGLFVASAVSGAVGFGVGYGMGQNNAIMQRGGVIYNEGLANGRGQGEERAEERYRDQVGKLERHVDELSSQLEALKQGSRQGARPNRKVGQEDDLD